MTLNKDINLKLSYEEALLKLEEIVANLEQGDVALEQALLVYQEGIELVSYCHQIINKVEEKLTVLNISTSKGEE